MQDNLIDVVLLRLHVLLHALNQRVRSQLHQGLLCQVRRHLNLLLRAVQPTLRLALT
jgi:hypothetical protein